ncbi:MAG: peptidase MA family metallohydrolase [Clostridia bacterium]|nr:peptidase MA family metallohydrolase [Clostridia bacterium]
MFQKGTLLVLEYQTSDFDTVESNNFELKYTKNDEDIAICVLKMAEEYLIRAEKLLEFRHKKDKVLLVLFEDEKALNKSFGWSGDKSAVGVYWAGSIRLVSPRAWADEDLEDADTEKIEEIFRRNGPLSHELTHFLIDEMTEGNYPRWLTEGLAQYVEEKITGFTLNEPLFVSEDRVYLFSKLNSDFDNKPDQVMAYWQSFEIVRALIKEFGMEKMDELLDELRRGTKFNQAFERTYNIYFCDYEEKFLQEVTLS